MKKVEKTGNPCESNTHTHTQKNFNGKENKIEVRIEEERRKFVNNNGKFNDIKSSKGITLVALVVSIIVLLILAMVSVSALVGENGIISMAKESRTLSILADILFDTESEIVNINIDNIETNQKYTALDMLKKLVSRKKIKKQLFFNNALQSETEYYFEDTRLNDINGDRNNDLRVGYNGDVWLGNYKRGKIQLSPETNTIHSSDGKTKITVIDGTVEEIASNQKYFLHALDRDDFAYWLDKHGEIISSFPDTIVFIVEPRDEEYTAIYSSFDKDNQIYHRPDYYGSGIVSRLTHEEDSDKLEMECYYTYLYVPLITKRLFFFIEWSKTKYLLERLHL